MSAVGIIGAGSWGTALAIHLARRGLSPRLWARDPALARELRERARNPRYLPGIALPPGILATSEGGEALGGASIVIVAVPSQFLRAVMARLGTVVPRGAIVVSATKGLEPDRGLRVSQLLGEILPGSPVAVLSGPSFAREVALGLPTALVVASGDRQVARFVQQELASPEFRLYTNRDVIGVELAGALKNVVAIAAGLSDSLYLGENARAALVTRGLAEIVRLGVAFGASARTFLGLAGLGDLVLTATGTLSRNRALGLEVGRGKSLAEVEGSTRSVAEGARTVASALRLAAEAKVSMPICEAVASVLHGGTPAARALAGLLARSLQAEDEGDDG
ncbi:MAG: NAD(P)-dependent glycerol-3-phosphate dehydrogenase [Candidatus Rokubacteria bacterium]|nr:NAD(P)-dependent glycerol-3-phosphate dehydrogenase [Candidatus Rokubacteria bacterium]